MGMKLNISRQSKYTKESLEHKNQTNKLPQSHAMQVNLITHGQKNEIKTLKDEENPKPHHLKQKELIPMSMMLLLF